MRHSEQQHEQTALDQVELIRLKEVDSTNSYLRQYTTVEQVKEFVVAVAESQLAGRGQRGNSWESESGKNLTFSIAMRPDFLQANNQFVLSQAMALSVKETLDEYLDNIAIKWPNDIYWKEKKIAGILIENELIGKHIERSIIGVGVNINQREFHSNAPNPVSLWQITRETVEPETILHKILKRFICYYNLIRSGESDDLIYRYDRALFRRDGFHRYLNHKEAESDLKRGETFEACIHHIEPDGHLILQTRSGETYAFGFKEVEFLF